MIRIFKCKRVDMNSLIFPLIKRLLMLANNIKNVALLKVDDPVSGQMVHHGFQSHLNVSYLCDY